MATVKIEAGRGRFYPRGAWSNSVKYDFFDLVTNGGSSYICINTSGAPAGTALSNGTYWALLAEKGDTGPQGAAGPTGPTGAAGTAATITIGTVTTGAAGTNAVVTNVGTATAAKLNFTIPRGATGATGPQGPSGAATVSLKGTRSADGNWTITGLTVNKPLYIFYHIATQYDDEWVKCRVISGSSIGTGFTSATYQIGKGDGNIFITIPTSTTVVIDMTFAQNKFNTVIGSVYAYQ